MSDLWYDSPPRPCYSKFKKVLTSNVLRDFERKLDSQTMA